MVFDFFLKNDFSFFPCRRPSTRTGAGFHAGLPMAMPLSTRYSHQIDEDDAVRWHATFQEYDTDGSGDVDLRELGLLFRRLGQAPSEARMKCIIFEADVSHRNAHRHSTRSHHRHAHRHSTPPLNTATHTATHTATQLHPQHGHAHRHSTPPSTPPRTLPTPPSTPPRTPPRAFCAGGRLGHHQL